MIGYFVIGLVLLPLLALMLAAILDPPRQLRVPAMFTLVVLLEIGAMVAGMAVFAALLTFIVPQ
jgi:hypothetical protein